MDADTCRRLFASSPVARLATIGQDGPHIVPVTFAVDGDEIVSAVDHKPKRSTTLQRLANIAANPAVALLVDDYHDDWKRLWWVRADGAASIVESAMALTTAIDLLVSKYAQYRFRRPDGPVIAVSVDRWSGWMATPRDGEP